MKPYRNSVDGLQYDPANERAEELTAEITVLLAGITRAAEAAGVAIQVERHSSLDAAAVSLYFAGAERSTVTEPVLVLHATSRHSFEIIRHRTENLTLALRGKRVNAIWIYRFVENAVRERLVAPPKSQRAQSRSALSSRPIYYVYEHTFSNGAAYIGKGLWSRMHEVDDARNLPYTLALRQFGQPVIRALALHLTEGEAYRREVAEIRAAKQSGKTLLNLNSGGEDLPLVDTPGGSIKRFFNYEHSDPELFRTGRLVKRNSDGSSTTSRYLDAISLAQETDLTPTEVLSVFMGTVPAVNDWSLAPADPANVTNSEWEQLGIPEP